MKSNVTCHAWILEGAELSFYFVLENPATASGPVLVPRVLAPLGAFVSLQVVDSTGSTIYETNPPKFTPKLDPQSEGAYVAIDPGYGYGTKFVIDDAPSLPAGTLDVKISYSNLYFRGSAEHALGDQQCSTVVRHQRR